MASLSLTITRAKTGLFDLTVTESDGSTPQNLHGSTLYFHASNGICSIDKNSPDNGIAFTSEIDGEATLTINPADTEILSQTGTYSMPCELTMVVGQASYEVATGTMFVYPNVGTP